VDRQSLDDIAAEFQIKLYETALALGRESLSLTVELAELYTQVGRYQDGLILDRNLVERDPDNPVFHYNLACSLSLVGQTDPAFLVLDQAIELGFRDFKLLLEDRDLKNLHADPRWKQLVSRITRGTNPGEA
jgi:tetratricopeptide (TPR) repeat protein